MKKILLLICAILFSGQLFAANSFLVKKIEIIGLQRVAEETVDNYLPIKEGQVLRPGKTADIVKALYKTGFFESISLERDGSTLIINVVERPTIGKLKISGNSYIATDKLTSVMKSVNVTQGRVYDRVVLERIKQSLLNQYFLLGRYNARVDVSVSPMPRNRVKVNIEISEGLVAKVRHINIIGNHAFKERTLQKQLELTTPGLLTFFTRTDRYTQEKLDASLEKLRSFYMDRGYIKFNVKSSQVALTPDRKSIFLTLVIDEGDQYKVSSVQVTGETILSPEVIREKIKIKPGDVFSRKITMDADKEISDALGKEGYVFSVVAIEPILNEKTQEVALTYNIHPGKRAYVRHIYFTDNTKTNDGVLRREVLQMESSVVSTKKLEDSKRRISLLPFIRDVQMNVVPVANSNDRVDVNYKVVEQDAAEAKFSIGYSQVYHVMLGLGFNQKNFLGTGKTLGINLTRSKYQQYYGINYTNPYYTPDGISRSINFSLSKINPHQANITSGFTTNQYNLSVIYGIPIGQDPNVMKRIELGYGIEDTLVKLTNPYSQQVQAFVQNNGRHFQQLTAMAGVSRDGRDKAIFPTSGSLQSVGLNMFVPLNTSLAYYMLNYSGRLYQPLYKNFILLARGNLGYGDAKGGSQNYPFFKNYYGGGLDSVPGYLGNTLGPKDSIIRANGFGEPTGGNFMANASIGLIFPNGFSENVRTTLFVAGGNVYNTYDNRKWNGTGSGPLRYSSGVAADWLSPFGMIELSLAKALNPRPGDITEFFQFSLGANFG